MIKKITNQKFIEYFRENFFEKDEENLENFL